LQWFCRSERREELTAVAQPEPAQKSIKPSRNATMHLPIWGSLARSVSQSSPVVRSWVVRSWVS